jgi:DNA-binding PadR family transcriptional regulator
MHGCHSFTTGHPLAGWFAMSRGSGSRRGGRPHGRPGGGQSWGFPGFGPPRGPRARRGDVRAALLVLLAEEPRNGYQLMQEIERRSDGVWRPSPGSVYPALQLLEDEGLVGPAPGEGAKAFTLTDTGRAHVEAHRDELGAPWDDVKGDMGEGARELMGAMRHIGLALFQLTHSGSEAQQQEAKEVLAETRRALYRILAEDPPSDAGEA